MITVFASIINLLVFAWLIVTLSDINKNVKKIQDDIDYLKNK